MICNNISLNGVLLNVDFVFSGERQVQTSCGVVSNSNTFHASIQQYFYLEEFLYPISDNLLKILAQFLSVWKIRAQRQNNILIAANLQPIACTISSIGLGNFNQPDNNKTLLYSQLLRTGNISRPTADLAPAGD